MEFIRVEHGLQHDTAFAFDSRAHTIHRRALFAGAAARQAIFDFPAADILPSHLLLTIRFVPGVKPQTCPVRFVIRIHPMGFTRDKRHDTGGHGLVG